MKNKIKNLSLIAVSVIITLVLVEGMLHLMTPPASESWRQQAFCKDPYLGKVMVPGVSTSGAGPDWHNITFTANAHGYRDSPWSQKKGPNKILMLGDSFCWAWGVDFEKSLGHFLDTRPRFQVYNLCMPGDGIPEYQHKFLVFHQKIKPDFTLVVTYVNDFFDEKLFKNKPEPWQVPGIHPEDEIYRPDCQARPKFRGEYLLEKSYLYRSINLLRISAGLTFNHGKRLEQATKNGYRKDVAILNKNDPRLGLAMHSLFKLLVNLKNSGGNPVVVYIPPIYAIRPATMERIRKVFGEDAGDFDPQLAPDYLARVSDSSAVPLLDLSPLLRDVPDAYFPHDGHLNEKGHNIAGLAINNFLDSLKSAK